MGHIHRDVVDKGLTEILVSANGINVCWGAPSNYGDAVGQMALGSKSFPPGGGFYAIGSVGNTRQIASRAITDGTTNVTGTAASWAVIDSVTQRLLAVNDMTPLPVIKNSNWSLPSIGIVMQGLPALSFPLSPASAALTSTRTLPAIGPNLTPTARALAIVPGAAATAAVVLNSPIMRMPRKDLLTKPQGQVVSLLHLSGDFNDSTGRHVVTADPAIVEMSSRFTPKFGSQMAYVNTTGWDKGVSLDGGSDFNLDGDFTIDFWFLMTQPGWYYSNIYNHSQLQSLNILQFGSLAAANYLGYIWQSVLVGYPTYSSGSAPIPDNSWHHVALTRKDFLLRLFLDGQMAGTDVLSSGRTSITGDGAVYDNINYLASAGYPQFGLQNFAGGIQEARIIKGWAAWTASFTPPSAPYALTDFPVFKNAIIYPPSASLRMGSPLGHSMLMHFDKLMTEELGHSIQSSGSVVNDSSHWIKFGVASVRIQNGWFGINDITDDLQFGFNDFTIDFWLYLNSLSGTTQTIVDFRPPGTPGTWLQGAWPVIQMTTGNVLVFTVKTGGVSGTTTAKITGPTLATATAYHIALTRSAGQTRLFVNGSQVGSTYADTNCYFCGGPGRTNWPCPLFGGDEPNISATNVMGIDGWMDELRIVRGYAAWIANFTPPTKAYTLGDITNLPTIFVPLMISPPTAALALRGGGASNNNGVLLHFGSNFNDALGSTMTPSTTSPPTLDSSKLKFGVASAYFNGNTSCNLVILGSPYSKFDFPGDFTVDFWWMPQTSNSGGSVVHCWPGESGGPNPYNLDYHDGFGFWTDSTINMWGDGYSTWVFVGQTNLAVGTWYHIAVTRSGWQMKLFINGVSDATPNYPFYGRGSTALMTLGSADGYSNGWMAEFRIINGWAAWTSNFTPPTAPYSYIDPTATVLAIH